MYLCFWSAQLSTALFHDGLHGSDYWFVRDADVTFCVSTRVGISQPSTLNPKPSTLNPKLSTLNPQPYGSPIASTIMRTWTGI